jgi:hypothetical protein
MDYSITCKSCGKNFSSKTESLLHECEKYNLKARVYECNHCNKTFSTFKNLMNHSNVECTLCKENIPLHFLGRDNFTIENSILLGEVKNWDDHWLEYDLTKEDLLPFKHPIRLLGAFFGTYLSKIELPLGYICPDCFYEMKSKKQIIRLYSH